MESLIELLGKAKIIPVVTIERVEDAVPLATCLMSGGLQSIEVTLRTEAALEVIQRIADDVPECTVGAVSILDPERLEAAKRSGAQFGVSPGMTKELLSAIAKQDFPFLPGAATISEILALRSAGYFFQKLFPASLLGGPAYLKAAAGPVADVRFCPTGGVTAENARSYLALDNVFSLGGSWIAPPSAIASGRWSEIEKRACEAASIGR